MSERENCIRVLREASPFIQSEFGVRQMRLFGSMARGDQRPDSDVDIYVDMPPKAFIYIRLKDYLQKLLGRAVDVVREHSNLDKFLSQEINRDGITIFAE